jgi:hypothetical protein
MGASFTSEAPIRIESRKPSLSQHLIFMLSQRRMTPGSLFCSAVLLQQIGHNMQIANIQLILSHLLHSSSSLSHSSSTLLLSATATTLAVITSMDFPGASIGGLFLRANWRPETVLPVWMTLRTFLVSFGAFGWYANWMSVWSCAALVAIDYFAVGVLDTTRSVLPLRLVPKKTKPYDYPVNQIEDESAIERRRLNSNVETCFHAGNLIGPIVTALLVSVSGGRLGLSMLIPGFLFAITLAMFCLMRVWLLQEEKSMASGEETDIAASTDKMSSSKLSTNNLDVEKSFTGDLKQPIPWYKRSDVMVLFLVSGLCQFSRLKNLLPAIYVQMHPSASKVAIPWMTAAFGLGNTAGSYSARYFLSPANKKHSTSTSATRSKKMIYLASVFALILFGMTFVADSLYQTAFLVVASNFLLGLSWVHIGSDLQQALADQMWVVGLNRSMMRLMLLIQKAWIAWIVKPKSSEKSSNGDWMSEHATKSAPFTNTVSVKACKMKKILFNPEGDIRRRNAAVRKGEPIMSSVTSGSLASASIQKFKAGSKLPIHLPVQQQPCHQNTFPKQFKYPHSRHSFDTSFQISFKHPSSLMMTLFCLMAVMQGLSAMYLLKRSKPRHN